MLSSQNENARRGNQLLAHHNFSNSSQSFPYRISISNLMRLFGIGVQIVRGSLLDVYLILKKF